jgi:hypothetical protein
MPRTRYFSRDGRELSAVQALDAKGIVRSGVITRVPMTMADGARPGLHYPRQHFTVTDARQYWDRNRDTLLVTDARGIGGTEGNKPGFRVLDNDLGRSAKDAALRDHERYLNDAFKNPLGRDAESVEEEDADGERQECPACSGSGYDADGERCRRCQGTGEVPDDDDEEAEAVADAKRRRRRPEPDDDDDDPPFGSQDGRSVDQIAHEHRRNMAKIYDAYARELSEAWKGGK